MTLTFKEFLRGAAGRAAEPEEEDGMQGCCNSVTQQRYVVGMFVACITLQAEHGYIAHRAFSFTRVEHVRY